MTSLTKALILLMALNVIVFNDETIVSAMNTKECIAKNNQLLECSPLKWNVQELATGDMSDPMCCNHLNKECATRKWGESGCEMLLRYPGSIMASIESTDEECIRRKINCSQLKTNPLSESCEPFKKYLDCKMKEEIPVHIKPKPKPKPKVTSNRKPTHNEPKPVDTSSHLISGPTLVIASIVVVIVIHVFN